MASVCLSRLDCSPSPVRDRIREKDMSETVVYVTIYSHKDGDDVAVWQSMESALNYQNQIAEEWWDHEFPDKPRPEDRSEIGQAYFDLVDHNGNEWFSISKCEVKQ